jgi:hypothetical protein
MANPDDYYIDGNGVRHQGSMEDEINSHLRDHPLPPPPSNNWYLDGNGVRHEGNLEDIISTYTHDHPTAQAMQTSLSDQMTKDAKKFRAGLGQYTDEQYSAQANRGREQLQGTLGTIKSAANQRGMLYSGLRQGAEGGARQNMASILANQRAQINTEASSLADTKDFAAANVGLAGFGDAVRRADDTYAASLQSANARNLALGQIGQGVGYGLGTLYAKKPKDDGIQGPAVKT